MPQTLYIAPAMTDQAGQCRIYSADGKVHDAARLYRQQPNLWKEVGIMNSRGKLVCCEVAFHEIRDMEPLMAGMAIEIGDDGKVV